MTATDDARFDALDRRGRAAARTLLDDLAARGTTTDTSDEASARHDRTEIHLGPGGHRRGSPARRTLLAAAVVAVLTAVGVTVAAVTGDDGAPDATPDVSSSGAGERFLPGWLPPGFEPVSTSSVVDSSAFGFEAAVTVYGDAASDDPWSEGLAVILLEADEELLDMLPSDGETVTVAGVEATLRRAESEGFGGRRPGGGWEVVRPVDGGLLTVVGALPRDDVLAAAGVATTEPAIDGAGLPEGFTELARGPMEDPSPFFTSLFEEFADNSVASSGFVVGYADTSIHEGVRPAIVVAQRPAPSSAVDLLRLSFEDGGEATVRGRHAAIGRGREPAGQAGESGVVAVQWAESEGRLVTVLGFGVDEETVLDVAEGLSPASTAEVAALPDQLVDAPRDFADPPAGHVVVASGDTPHGRWRVVADAGRQPNVGALTLDRLSFAIASTSSTTGDRVEPVLDLAADFSDGTAVVWGTLWEDAASVTVEAEGAEPVELGIYEVEGWDHEVVAGTFPVDFDEPPDGEVAVVARDADGREVARNTTVISGG